MKSTPSMSAKKPLPLMTLDQNKNMNLYNKPIGNFNQFKEIEQQLMGDK